MADLILALDFGGTKLSTALVERIALDRQNPSWIARRRLHTTADAEASDELAAMLDLAHSLLDGRNLTAVGVSFGGPVNYATGTVRLSHHVPGWENNALCDTLESIFQTPVTIDNDANAAALGEHRLGAGQGVDSLLYITVSTGVGGGWILNGRPWRSHESMAGELGHTVVDPNGPICLCGKRGCVERLASGRYMAQDAAELLDRDPAAGKILRRLSDGADGVVTGKMVAEAAALGDGLALDILLRGARTLGTGIGNVANLINPQRFILGGGVTHAGESWWTAVRETARSTALPEVSFDIVPASLGDDAPLWGAALLASEQLK